MPTPESSLATLRPDLNGCLMEFDLGMNMQGFIAPRVMPTLNVAKPSGNFGIIPIEQLLKARSTLRAPRAKYSRSDFTFQAATYVCQENGAEEPIDEEEAAMYAEYFDAEAIAAARAQSAVMLNREQRVADLLFNTTTYPSATSITNEWDDLTNATPISDVRTAIQAVWESCGLWANALVVSTEVYKNLRATDEIVAAVASSGAGDPSMQRQISESQIAMALDLDFVLAGGGAKNSAIEGQDVDIASIWSNEYAWVGRIATSQDIQEPCFGRTFHYTGTGSEIDCLIESYRDETVRADVIRARQNTHEKMLYSASGVLLDNLTT